MGAQRARSLLIRLPKASGVPPSTSAPWSLSFFFTSADCRALLISALSTATMSLGVPAGATKPNQVTASKSFTPDSAMVGTWGRSSTRLSEVTAIGRILPVLIWPISVGTEDRYSSTRPLTTSVAAWAAPL